MLTQDHLLEFLASSALFLLGLRLLSEGVQGLLGPWIERLVNTIGESRYWAMMTGSLLTSFHVMASTTIVMVVGYANAGLLSFAQSLSTIVGANLGAILLAWLLLVAKQKLAFILLSLGIVFWITSRKERWRILGKSLLSLGLMYLGFLLLVNLFHGFQVRLAAFFYEDMSVQWMVIYQLGLAFAGAFLTFAFQSSGYALAIALAIGFSGSVGVNYCLAMVAGLGLGNALLAWRGGRLASREPRRAVLVNLIIQFLVTGFLAATAHYFLVMANEAFLSIDLVIGATPVWQALFYTFVAFVQALLGIPFLGLWEKLGQKLIAEPDRKEPQRLDYFGDRFSMSSSLAMEQAHQEVKKMAAMVQSICILTVDIGRSDAVCDDLAKKVQKYEKITDNIQREIMDYLEKLMPLALTTHQAARMRCLLRLTDELECIADKCKSLVEHFSTAGENGNLPATCREIIVRCLLEILEFYELAFEQITTEACSFPTKKHVESSERKQLTGFLGKTYRFDSSMNTTIDQRMEEIKCSSFQPAQVAEAIGLLRTVLGLKDHVVNLFEALAGGKAQVQE